MSNRAAIDHEGKGDEGRPGILRSPIMWVLLASLALASIYLFTKHQTHLFGVLSWLLLLACPLMHFFMHGHHGHHRHRGDEPKSDGR